MEVAGNVRIGSSDLTETVKSQSDEPRLFLTPRVSPNMPYLNNWRSVTVNAAVPRS